MVTQKNSLTIIKIYLLTVCGFLLFGSIAPFFLDYPFIHGTVLFFFVLIPGFFNAFSIYYITQYFFSTSCIWRDRISLILFYSASIFLGLSFVKGNDFFLLWRSSIFLVLCSMWVLSWHFMVFIYRKKHLSKIHSFIVFSFVCAHGFFLIVIPYILLILIFNSINFKDIFWSIVHPISYAFIILMIGIMADRIFEYRNRFIVLFHHMIILLLVGLGLIFYLVYVLQNKNPFGSESSINLTMLSGVPIFFLLIYWIIALWKNNISLNIDTCFALMCMSLFIFGGLMDIFFIHYHLPIRLGDTYFTVAHFHLIIGVCIAMSFLSCIYHNWRQIFIKCHPKILDNRFSKIHFWTTFIGVYVIFSLMYYVGLIGIPKLYFTPVKDLNYYIGFSSYTIMSISIIVWVMQIAFIFYLLRATFKSYCS
ncbi:MAG: cbb3-type cytochrome c oxidase subunit I [Chitinophagaceae bacterium]